jgi:hypothetical protein
MVPVRRALFILIVPFVLTASVRAQTSITLTKPNAHDVLVTINGTGPFDIFRSQSADLTTNTETLSSDQPAVTYTDAAAQQATAVVYYYDVIAEGEPSLAMGAAGMPQQSVMITSVYTEHGHRRYDSVHRGKWLLAALSRELRDVQRPSCGHQ